MPLTGEQYGLIGAGLLGGAIAERLRQQGAEVLAFDLDSARLDALAPAGVAAADSASELLQQSDTVLLSLPNSEVVDRLLEAESPSLREGMTIVDTTTGDPRQMEKIGRRLASRGVTYVEANVAGSSVQLQAGQAKLFLGADPAAVERLQPLLDALADQRFHLGPVGAASRFKLVHNLILGLHRAVLAEGLSLAAALGFDAEQPLQILRQTPAASDVMRTKGPKMASRDWTPQAKLSQHLKDVRLMLEEARRTGSPTPLSQAHMQLLEQAEALGFGEADNSAVLEAYRRPQEP